MSGFGAALTAAFGDARVIRNARLGPLTTFRVGGVGDWLVETRASDEIITCLTLASLHGVQVTMLGGGSNVLISDSGVRGLVIRPRGGTIHRIDQSRVLADAAVSINGLVRWMILHGAAGLEAWAGTPGSVGGAIFGNAHFGGRLIGEFVVSARISDQLGNVREVAMADMGFGYDRSRLQESGEVLLAATFSVSRGDPAAMREVARQSLAFRKRTQPLERPSAGCIFQNPDPNQDALPPGIPYSAGALVDRAGLKGVMIGGARVSPTHGNFIVNDGSATATDIWRLIAHCRAEVLRRFGVHLREEIVYLGEFHAAGAPIA